MNRCTLLTCSLTHTLTIYVYEVYVEIVSVAIGVQKFFTMSP